MHDYYEIRRDGVTLCTGTVPLLGYPTRVLLAMYESGLYLYRNGKRVKKMRTDIVGINPDFDYLYDPQQARPVCFCLRCGGEIYAPGKSLCSKCEEVQP